MSSVWRPLLRGELATRALAVVRAATERHRDLAPDITGNLFGGAGGVSLLHAYMARHEPGCGHEDRAVDALLSAPDRLRDPIKAGMAWGVAGLAWVTEHLRTHGFTELEVDATLDEFLLDRVIETPWDQPYDLMDGLVGIGVAVIDRVTQPIPRQIAEHVLARLEEIALPRGSGTTFAFVTDDRRAEAVGPESALGPAHGVSGVAALLGRFVVAGIAVDRAQRLLAGLTQWLVEQRLPDDAPTTFPVLVGDDREPMGGGGGWCHGDLGIAIALLTTARRIGDGQLETVSVEVLRAASQRARFVGELTTVGLCHGEVGNAHMFARGYQLIGDSGLRDAALSLYERTLEHWERERDNKLLLLRGTVGIALALLSAATDIAPDWDAALLMS